MENTNMTRRLTVGREDRLVRGCVAFSLVLMALFVVLASQGIALTSFLFLLVGGYFAITAATGWDPLYHRFHIDTRSDDELAEDAEVEDGPEAGTDLAQVLGLRHKEPVANE